MRRVLLLSLGEVILKGKNRHQFINRIVQNIKQILPDSERQIEQNMGKLIIEVSPEEEEEFINRLKFVFGTVYITPAWEIDTDESVIIEQSYQYMEELLKRQGPFTFKVLTRRVNKEFSHDSMEMNRKMGELLLERFPELSVDVHKPQVEYYIEIKKKTYIYHEKIATYGGLPLGSNGKGLTLLSGGIDSPVAAFLMAKRGVQMDALHFHSYPFTSVQAEDKVLSLGRVLAQYTTKMDIYSVNILPIQKAIHQNCPEEFMTVLSRRFMMRIASSLSDEYGYNSITTGENLGQVASQTLQGLTVVDRIETPIIFRPLIGMDKLDIIAWAERIGTYDISIQPFEDCCTVFLPKHPALRPAEEEILSLEEKLPVEELIHDAIDKMKIHHIDGRKSNGK